VKTFDVFEQLQLNDEQRGIIEHFVMFRIYEKSVKANFSPDVDLNGISEEIVDNFAGNMRVAAFYTFGNMQTETKTGENNTVIRELAMGAFFKHGTTEITPAQFDDLCVDLGEWYAETNQIEVEEQ
jgi:hypothetical protein